MTDLTKQSGLVRFTFPLLSFQQVKQYSLSSHPSFYKGGVWWEIFIVYNIVEFKRIKLPVNLLCHYPLCKRDCYAKP